MILLISGPHIENECGDNNLLCYDDQTCCELDSTCCPDSTASSGVKCCPKDYGPKVREKTIVYIERAVFYLQATCCDGWCCFEGYDCGTGRNCTPSSLVGNTFSGQNKADEWNTGIPLEDGFTLIPVL